MEREYQFPPQLNQQHIYFGYSGSAWLLLIGLGILSFYLLMLTFNILSLLPMCLLSLLLFRPLGKESVMCMLKRAYVYFIAEPMVYDYNEGEYK